LVNQVAGVTQHHHGRDFEEFGDTIEGGESQPEERCEQSQVTVYGTEQSAENHG